MSRANIKPDCFYDSGNAVLEKILDPTLFPPPTCALKKWMDFLDFGIQHRGLKLKMTHWPHDNLKIYTVVRIEKNDKNKLQFPIDY